LGRLGGARGLSSNVAIFIRGRSEWISRQSPDAIYISIVGVVTLLIDAGSSGSQLKSCGGNDFAPRLHGWGPEGSVRSCCSHSWRRNPPGPAAATLLTRSLADFAKIVDVLDAHDASFVSVTQQFNTTTSMGRLTLNMLLSFDGGVAARRHARRGSMANWMPSSLI
jgi:hypothetical protein